MRINKFISETGFCSRREADKIIGEGRVTINGQIAHLGTIVEANDRVCIDGKSIGKKRQHVYIALNKPIGITCTTERHIEGNIVDFVNHPERIFHIGRLDKDSQGLILLTNDGDIVNKVLRAENNNEKEYIVTVNKPITPYFMQGMSKGVKILGTTTKPCKLTPINEKTFRVVLTQGLNRQIRRMCQAFGYKVVNLKRIRIMNIQLGDLKVGKWRNLTQDELRELRKNL